MTEEQAQKKLSAPKRTIADDITQALYIPAFNQGFNDLIIKPVAGAVDLLDRGIDKAYTAITGEETPKWLRKGGVVHNFSKTVDNWYEQRDKPTNLVSETAEGVVGTVPLIAGLFNGSTEASMAQQAPQLFGKLSKVLATTKGLTGFKDATERGEDLPTSLGSAATEGIKGGIEGQFMDAQILVGGALGNGVVKKLVEKGLFKGGKATEAILHALSVGTVFGGTSAGENLLNGEDINTRDALKQFGMGLAFEIIPTAKGINDEIKTRTDNKKINDNTLQNAAVATSASNMNAESAIRTLINTPAEQLKQIRDDVPGSYEDLYADSIEQGAKAFETKDNNEKKNYYLNQLTLKSQADVKMISEKIKQDPIGVADAINSANDLSPEQKTELLTKVQELASAETTEPAFIQAPETSPVAEASPEPTQTPVANNVVPETAPIEAVQPTEQPVTNEPQQSEQVAPLEMPTPVREQVSDADAPKLSEMVNNIPEIGNEGISIEEPFKKDNKGMFTNEPLDNGTQTIVSRDKDGKVNGVLEVSYNGKDGVQDKPVSVKVVVDENSRRQGIATKLFKHAQDNGIDVESVRGKETTAAGQALYEANTKAKKTDILAPQTVESRKKGVDFVYEKHKEKVLSIGTPEEYQKYLDTVFPDSKVKDVLYRLTKPNLESFERGNTTKGIYASGNIEEVDQYKSRIKGGGREHEIYPVLMDIKNPQEYKRQYSKSNTQHTTLTHAVGEGKDGLTLSDYDGKKNQEVAVVNPEQVHILGSEKDLQGFKDWKKNQLANKPKTASIKNESTKEQADNANVEIKDTVGTKRSSDMVDADATKEIEGGYDTPDLVDRVLNKKHVTTDTENAILSKYIDAKKTELDGYNKELAENGATLSKAKFNDLVEAKNKSQSEYQDALQAARKTGTEAARSLGSRRFSFNEETSLENMIVRKREALGGEKLTPEQFADVTAKYEALQELQKRLETRIQQVESENSKLRANQKVKSAAERVKRKSVTKAELAEERTKIFKSIRDDFSKIRKSNTLNSAIPFQRQAQELAALAKHVPEILRNFALEGVVEIKDVVDRLHDEFKGDIDGLTKRDITDVLAGGYNEQKPTKNQLQRDIQSLRTQAKIINQIEDLQKGIKPANENKQRNLDQRIQELRQRLDNLLSESEPTKEEKDLISLKKRIQSNIDKVKQKLDAGDYEKEVSTATKPDAEALRLRREYDRIKQEFDVEVAKDQLKQRTRIEKLKDDLLNIGSLPRALKASLDFSAVLRQGLFASVGHPKQALNAFTEMFRQTFSEEKYRNWLSDLKHTEMYDLMKESDLYISDKHDPKLLAREEEFTSNLAERIPGIGKLVTASERAYTGYLNVLRTGVFTSEARKLIERGYTPEQNPEQFKALAKVVNVLTGRGDIPEFLGGKQPKMLSQAFFSPRFMASRIQTLYIWADPRLPKQARILAAKDIGATLGTAALFSTLFSLAGATVNTDPRSSNFMKVKDKEEKGDTYYDLFGGLPQYVRFLGQQISGQKQPANEHGMIDLTSGKYGKPTRLTEAARFIRGKFSPLIGSGINLMEGKDVVGQPYHFWPNVPQEFVPLPYTDVKEAYDVGGIDNALKVLLPTQFGIGASSYNPNAKKPKK